MTSKIKNTTVLARIDFPLYSIQFLTCRHILVAGGGGSSKTGVSNEFKCFELFYNNGEVSAQEVLSYETGSYAVSNFAVITKSKHVYIVAGLESRSQLYRIKYSIRSEGDNISHELKNGENPSDILKSRKNKFENKNHSFNGLASKKLITFQILPENVIQTDFHPEEPDQKVVRVSPKNNLIATGGADGHVRIWEFPFLKLKLDIAAHKDEIDDLDFDLTGTQVVSISKDRTGVIWDVSTGNKIHDLKWTPPNGTKYLYRRCRFSVLEGDPNAHCIFMITNLNDKRTGKIQLWNSRRGVLFKQNDFKENLSALAVRNDGRFVAVGTMVTGTVLLLTSFNLQIVLQIPNAHGAFITGLQFIPVSKSDDDSFTTMSEASVISISVDRKICIHSLPYRDTMSVWILVIMVFFIILITFTICSFVGL